MRIRKQFNNKKYVLLHVAICAIAEIRRTRSSAVAERPRKLRVIEYFAKSLKIIQDHSK